MPSHDPIHRGIGEDGGDKVLIRDILVGDILIFRPQGEVYTQMSIQLLHIVDGIFVADGFAVLQIILLIVNHLDIATLLRHRNAEQFHIRWETQNQPGVFRVILGI